MHPSIHAAQRPDAAAIIMVSSGETVSYAQLEERSNRGARLFRSLGLQVGDAIAIWMENNARYLEICWAAHRAGLYFTPISSHLTAEEAAYIINDCGAKVLVASVAVGKAVNSLVENPGEYLDGNPAIYTVGGAVAGAADWEQTRDEMPAQRIADETAGQHMVYSSGTTGRPKGIRLPLTGAAADAPLAFVPMLQEQYGVTTDTIYLSPAPLYHTSPLVYCMNVQSVGGTVVILEKFEPEAFLAAIERFQVNCTQMVPTMFVRLLKLPAEIRERFDHSSLQVVVHAAAPCPVPIKHQMIDWWGQILYEFYGGSEANGSTYITSAEWLQKPGSVGKAIWGILHICDDEGHELPAGQTGMVYFEGGMDFQYSNDPEKTKEARNPLHPLWSTLGDVGFMDEDGYLFLTDRKSFMIISGGVNIYPQEIENLLVTHPKVADVAVIGVPHPDFGEEVKAVVQALNPADAGPTLEQELLAFCKQHLSTIKCPRSVDFDPQLPRMDNGKLYKKQVRARYWEGRENTLA
jgi:acyl-CoA synthetase (AMP-forming)/AMP-acid ligase II